MQAQKKPPRLRVTSKSTKRDDYVAGKKTNLPAFGNIWFSELTRIWFKVTRISNELTRIREEMRVSY